MTTTNLPRENNLPRVRSIFSRSVAKMRAAAAAYKENPNDGTRERRIDRTRATRAQSARVAFVRAYLRQDLRGAARTAHVRKAARIYRSAMRRWAENYNRASGWGMYRS